MTLITAFAVSQQDVAAVLARNVANIQCAQVRTIDGLASSVYESMSLQDHERVARAALKASTDLDKQTDCAHEALAELMRERGVLAQAAALPQDLLRV